MAGSLTNMASSAVSSTASNFMSIGSAPKRKRQVNQKYEAQANVALQNARIMKNKATEMRLLGRSAEKSARVQKNNLYQQQSREQASSFVSAANSGVQVEGTPLLALETQIQANALQRRQITYQGYLTKKQYKDTAVNYDYQMKLNFYQARKARAVEKYKKEVIDYQKKLTIAKMFYDPGNATSFGEVDNPSQFEHFDSSSIGNIAASYQPNVDMEPATKIQTPKPTKNSYIGDVNTTAYQGYA